MADDARLREMYTAATEAARTDHPGDEVWEALALGEAKAVEREQLHDHVIACAACAEIYRGLMTLEAEARRFDPGVPRALTTPPQQHSARAWYVGLAAAAALLLAFLLPFRMTSPPPDDGVRAPVVSTPVAIAPVGELASAPAVFRFAPLTGVASHRVELSRADGEPLWTSADLAGAQITWPADVRMGAGVYYWRVVAVPDPDRRLSSPVASPWVSFSIAPR